MWPRPLPGPWRRRAPLQRSPRCADSRRRGVALWALAQLGDAEARPLIQSRLEAPLALLGNDAARQALAAWAAGDLGLTAAIGALDRLASRGGRSPVVSRFAREALESIRTSRRPHAFLLLPLAEEQLTGVAVRIGQCFTGEAVVIPTDGVPADYSPVVWCGTTTPRSLILGRRDPVVVRRDGELALCRRDPARLQATRVDPGLMLRVTLTP
jgi:hypothetical protein